MALDRSFSADGNGRIDTPAGAAGLNLAPGIYFQTSEPQAALLPPAPEDVIGLRTLSPEEDSLGGLDGEDDEIDDLLPADLWF